MAVKSYMRVENVVKKFGPFTALDGVDLDIAPGEVHALLGDNGAGKSTLIKIMSGVHQPTSGSIYVDDKKVFFRNPIKLNCIARIYDCRRVFILFIKYLQRSFANNMPTSRTFKCINITELLCNAN